MPVSVKIITRFADYKTGKLAPTVWTDGVPPRSGDRTMIELSDGARYCVECRGAVVAWNRDAVTGERVQVWRVTYRKISRIVDAMADDIVGEV